MTEAKTGDVVTAIRVLSVARNSMIRQRTAAINAHTALLRTVELGIDACKPLTGQQIQRVAAWRAREENLAECVSPAEAVRLAKLIVVSAEQVDNNAKELHSLVTEVRPELLALTGVGAMNLSS